MNKNEFDPKDETKKVAEEHLTEEDLKKVSGGFNPQPDPPGKS